MRWTIALLILALASPVARANPRARYIRSHYTKFEHRVPMRDGKRLFTSVYLPNDRAKRYPILLLRTPYSVGPYGSDRYRSWLGPSEAFEKAEYGSTLFSG